LLFKLELCNPTASYKDRFVAAEVARILRLGARACVATSSGNTGASLAAYCARYGPLCFIVVNTESPPGKLA
jgi:threonine synthase